MLKTSISLLRIVCREEKQIQTHDFFQLGGIDVGPIYTLNMF